MRTVPLKAWLHGLQVQPAPLPQAAPTLPPERTMVSSRRGRPVSGGFLAPIFSLGLKRLDDARRQSLLRHQSPLQPGDAFAEIVKLTVQGAGAHCGHQPQTASPHAYFTSAPWSLSSIRSQCADNAENEQAKRVTTLESQNWAAERAFACLRLGSSSAERCSLFGHARGHCGQQPVGSPPFRNRGTSEL